MAERKKRKPRVIKPKYIGVVIKELRTGGKTYEVGKPYKTTHKGSYEYLINAGYIVSKQKK